jgi:hypothetical protein
MFKVQSLFVNIFLTHEFVTLWNKKSQWTILNERHEVHSLSPSIAQAQLLHLARDHCASHAKHVYTFLHVELVFTQLEISFHGSQIKYAMKMKLNFHVFKMVSILRWEKKKEKVIAQLSSLFPPLKLLPYFHVLIFIYKKTQLFD